MSDNILSQSPAVIEGIGPAFEQALAAGGVNTVADMLRREPAGVQDIIPNMPREQIDAWFAAAWLLMVDGVTPDIAEAFVDDGIDTIEEMGEFGLRTLELAVKRAQKAGKLDEAPSIYRLAALQRQAIRLGDTAPFVGRVLDQHSGNPVPDLTIRFGGRSARTDANGMFYLLGVPEGEHTLRIDSGFQKLMSGPQRVRSGRLGPMKTYRITLLEQPQRTVREIDGALIATKGTTEYRFRTRKLDELPDGAYLLARSRSRTGRTKLLNLFRTQVASAIIIEQVSLDEEDLPAGTTVGTVLHLESGQLSKTDLTIRDVARMKYERVFGPSAAVSAHAPGQTRPAIAGLAGASGDEDAGTKYYFHGDDGCAICQSATGYYQEEPLRPHPDCDCEIEELEPEPEPDDDDCEYKYVNPSITPLNSWIDTEDSSENCEGPRDLTVLRIMLPYEDEQWDTAEFENSVKSELGITGPEVIENSAEILVRAFTRVDYTVSTLREARLIYADLVKICPTDNGNYTIELIDTHSGWIERDTLIRINDPVSEGCGPMDPDI